MKSTEFATNKKITEGAELKQAKRKYNQAAKDANADQVGAGKKIDTMKKSLRQRDVNKQGMAEDNSGTPVHRIGLTVTDPNHPMVSKRGETIQKTVRVKGTDREKAINSAIAHYRRKGYKVHDHHYIGTVDAEPMAEGVAETLPMSDAVKVLKHYGAEHFKTTSNELHFYKNGRGLSVDLVWNDDATRSVNLSSLNSATRALKGQGVAEGESQAYRDAMAKSREAEINFRADNAEKRLAMKAAQPKTLGQKIKRDIGEPLKKLAAGDVRGALGENFGEPEPSPVASAITRRIMHQRTDLLKYGPVAVMAAIDDVADWIGDVEEIGSSDVSGWVKQVERMLAENPPEAFGVGMDEGAYDQYDLDTDEDDYEDSNEGFYVCIGSEDEGGFVGMVYKDGGKWREQAVSGNAPYNWGGSYMSYLTPQDVMQHIRNDYGRHAEVEGPFTDEEQAVEYARMQYDLE